MGAAESRPSRSLAALAIGLALGLGGCAAPRACYCREASAPVGEFASQYTIACPDVLELAVAPRHDGARAPVEPDGTIALTSGGRVRVDGLTVAEVADKLAAELHVSRPDIHIRIAEYASRQVFLCGPVAGTERAVPYQGPEPVVAFLRRIGGLAREAEPRDVHVIRANVAAGRRPEVFEVDLKAILVDHDDNTNVLLQPYDQVYVGESARANWEKCLPPWMHISRQQAAGSRQQAVRDHLCLLPAAYYD